MWMETKPLDCSTSGQGPGHEGVEEARVQSAKVYPWWCGLRPRHHGYTFFSILGVFQHSQARVIAKSVMKKPWFLRGTVLFSGQGRSSPICYLKEGNRGPGVLLCRLCAHTESYILNPALQPPRRRREPGSRWPQGPLETRRAPARGRSFHAAHDSVQARDGWGHSRGSINGAWPVPSSSPSPDDGCPG